MKFLSFPVFIRTRHARSSILYQLNDDYSVHHFSIFQLLKRKMKKNKITLLLSRTQSLYPHKGRDKVCVPSLDMTCRITRGMLLLFLLSLQQVIF